ncbi:MAG TPA: polyprenol monophosphomannose synthase [Acidimicrobiales bacterium]|nr:polyprenol monophosphomannose synthase [Acidimicrobiales bacterium]
MKGHNDDGAGFSEAGARPCTLSVVVPTRNEALNVGPLAARLQAALSQTAGGWELIFVDDSDDNTPEVVARLVDEVGVGSPVRLLHRPTDTRSGGLGGAVRDGFAIARGRVVAVMDADLQHPPEVLPALIGPVLSGEADLVAGSRYGWAGADAGLSSPWRHLVSGGCRWLVHLLVPDSRPLQDPLSGLFALRRSLLDGVELRPAGYKILLEVTVRARPATVGNVGFNFAPRHAGRSKASLREGLVFLRHLARLVRASGRGRADRPEGPAAIDIAGVDLRTKQLLEPIEES